MMNELNVLMADNEAMRQLVGLYELEKERADRAERCIDAIEAKTMVGRIYNNDVMSIIREYRKESK